MRDFPRFNIDNVDSRGHTDKKFLVTRIGCGVAGYNSAQIVPLFSKAVLIPNILLPRDFWRYLL